MALITKDLSFTTDEQELIEQLLRFCDDMILSHPEIPVEQCRIAGGWVRDKLLGLDSQDLDLAITSLTGRDFAEAFVRFLRGNSVEWASDLKVKIIEKDELKSKNLETATFSPLSLSVDVVHLRSESYSGDSRVPDRVGFGTPLEDALRRDLTINSLFYNIHTKEVEDFTGTGLADLLEHTTPYLRTPLPAETTFLDDPLRLLRAIRFAGRFRGRVDPDIARSAGLPSVRAALMQKVTRERVGVEVTKMLQCACPLIPLQLIHELELYPLVFLPPEFSLDLVQGSSGTNVPSLEPEVSERAMSVCMHLGALLGSAPPLRDELLNQTTEMLKTLPTLQSDLLDICRACYDRAGRSTVALRRCLWLSAILSPLQAVGIEGPNTKRKRSMVDIALRDGLKTPTRDIDNISRILEAYDSIGKGQVDVQATPTRSSLGLLLRRLVHMAHFDSADAHVWSTWRWPLLIYLPIDLAEAQATERMGVLRSYDRLLCTVREYNEQQLVWTKPVFNGHDMMALLGHFGYKPGPLTAQLLTAALAWQLEHPYGTREDGERWLEARWRDLGLTSTLS